MLALAHDARNRLWTRTLIAAVTSAAIIGCGNIESGGGSRSVVAGGTATVAVYGFSDGKKLGFVMFTDIPSEGAVGSAGSTWTGQITPEKGEAVTYQGSASGLDINGSQYNFTNGRVFLVSTTEDTISVRQLNVPIGDAVYDTEIGRIVETEDVQAFLSK